MTQLSFYFPAVLHKSIDYKESSITDFIKEVLKMPDSKGKPNLANLAFNLRFNYAGEGGSPEIAGLEVTGATYDTETKKGKATISYRVERHYTCSDVKSQQKHTEVCPFEINLVDGLLLLQIPEDESRDTVFEL